MNQWSNSARKKLEDYFARVRLTLAASGADVNEVVEDLRRHVDEEIVRLKLGVVTEQDVGQILTRIGAPEAPVTPQAAEPIPMRSPSSPTPSKRPPGWFLLFFSVAVPLFTIGFEFFTGACAGEFFDPIPTLAHLVMVLLVPAANLLVWLAMRGGSAERWQTKLAWASGAAIAIAMVYAVMFLPLTPFALIGVLFYGFGLVPLGPAFALIGAILLQGHLRRSAAKGTPLKGVLPGVGAGLIALILVTLPMIITRAGFQMAVSESPRERNKGVRWLRSWGEEEEMLRACYGRIGRGSDIYSWGKAINPEEARLIYYRVTGRPFNAEPPPKLYAGRGRWNIVEREFTWDNDQASDGVGGRVRGLSLVGSRQDGFVDGDAALGYVEWTLEFKNNGPVQREARAQIALPQGGVVSRLTLWIDGEEREAAFGGRSQVKTAYKEVVERRRDPVLVTTCGPDRVLLQCFPVPPDGGVMKARIGITAPMALTNTTTGFLRWPCFLERNFTIAENFRHSVWLESKQRLETTMPKLVADGSKSGVSALHGEIGESELVSQQAGVRVARSPDVHQVWTRDTRAAEGGVIRQTLAERKMPAAESVIVVVDGSQGMKDFYPAIAAALSKLPSGIEFAMVMAKDGVEELSESHRGDADAYRRIGEVLRRARSQGGHDNVAALERGWDLAAEKANGAVIWIHGPQPVLFDSGEGLRQRLERRPTTPLLLEIQTRTGPNRITEQLDGAGAVKGVMRTGGLREDLERVFATLAGENTTLELVREHASSVEESSAVEGKETSLHLARLWAAEEISRLCRSRKLNEAMRLAGLYQLVTPISGAVVLETKAQFARAGLEPVSAESVPVVPEPSAWVFLVLVSGLIGLKLLHRGSLPARFKARLIGLD